MAARAGAARGGRRPKPVAERQRNRIMLALTDAELEAVERAAGEVPVATYVRECVLRAVARRRGRE